MRRFLALARTAALESLAEPLTAVLFLSGFAVTHLAPAFHYHQFGESGRLARECGFSALLVFGLVFATGAAIRTIGREIESGTAAAALALAVPRTLFLAARLAGVLSTLALFAVAIACATALAHGSSVLAAFARSEHGGSAQAWGPGLAAGVGFTLVALTLAAAANRFLNARFCRTACLALAAAQPLALVLAALCGRDLPPSFAGFFAGLWSLLPAFAALTVGCAVFVVFAGALATRLGASSVTAAVALAVVSAFVFPLRAVLPDINRFWLVDRLANGGVLGWPEVLPVLAAGLLLTAFWLAVGAILLNRRELP
jgi:hypothetical protein